MKKDKINSKDGQEITVFYLKDKHMEPNKKTEWKYGEPAPHQIHGKSDLQPTLDAYNISIGDHLLDIGFFGESDLSDYDEELDAAAFSPLIDDTIESDFLDVEELSSGSLYRVPKLNNLIVRYGGQAHYEGQHLLVWHHNFSFHVPFNSLVKANQQQIKNYLNK